MVMQTLRILRKTCRKIYNMFAFIKIKMLPAFCPQCLKMPHCRRLLCKIITTKMFLTSCSTKSLPIQDAIHLHFLSWLTDRGFHHVSLLVHETTQQNNPPLWEMHQSLTPCPTLTAQLGDNGSAVPP